MTSTTPTYAFPYPDPADPVANGDDTIRALAERTELVLGGGDVAPTWMAAQQNVAAGASVSVGSIAIPQTYRRRSLVVALFGAPGGAVSLAMNLTPNYADARLVDPVLVTRQYTAAAINPQVFYWHWSVAVGVAGVTQFQLGLGAGAALNNCRAQAWVI